MDVKILCLGVLTLGEASGYEIKKQLEEGPLAYFYHAGFGSIYPALKALYHDKQIDCFEVSQESRPGKKVYSITAKGYESFRSALSRKPAIDKIRSEVLLMFFFARFVDREHLHGVFEKYLEGAHKIVKQLESLDMVDTTPDCEFTNGLGRAIFGAIACYMEDNRQLLFGLERSNSGCPTTSKT
ncbi:MAG: PadR family transcriptional regulator [Alphaproteobacteria bacterium]